MTTPAASGSPGALAGAPGTESLEQGVASLGYAFVPAQVMRGLLEREGALSDWPAFAASWNELPVDEHMADHGRYRRRRHAVYAALPDQRIERRPHQAHFQALDYNPLNGGIERWFEPIDALLGDGPSMRAILDFCRGLFDRLAVERTAWHIEAHQFRIEAAAGEPGQPTPEGMHRDGVDFVLVLLIRRSADRTVRRRPGR